MEPKVTTTEKTVGNVTQRTHKEEIQIPQFTINDVLTKAELDKMSKKNMHKHIEYLEQIALQMNEGLKISIGELNLALKRNREAGLMD